MNHRLQFRLAAVIAFLSIATAWAGAPAGPATTTILKLDGVPMAVPPQSGRILAPTLHYDPSTKKLHMWVLTAGAPGESLTNMRHATSTDGLNFTSTGTMSYAGAPWSGTPWGT